MAVNLRNSIISSLNTGLRQSVTGGPTLWTPANLSGLSLWLDAADASTITLSGIHSVSQWNDKSDNNNHATQGIADSRPFYGTTTINTKNVVDFASGKFMITGARPSLNRTIAAVVQYSSTNGLKVIMGARRSTNERSYLGVNGGVVRTGVAEQGGLNGSSGISVDTTYTQILKHGQGAVNKEVHHYLDGTEDIDATFDESIGTTNRYFIGGFNDQGTVHASSKYGGLMAELVITDSMMSDSDREKLEGYFAHNWGHAGSLPADHPYKSSAPTV